MGRPARSDDYRSLRRLACAEVRRLGLPKSYTDDCTALGGDRFRRVLTALLINFVTRAFDPNTQPVHMCRNTHTRTPNKSCAHISAIILALGGRQECGRMAITNCARLWIYASALFAPFFARKHTIMCLCSRLAAITDSNTRAPETHLISVGPDVVRPLAAQIWYASLFGGCRWELGRTSQGIHFFLYYVFFCCYAKDIRVIFLCVCPQLRQCRIRRGCRLCNRRMCHT